MAQRADGFTILELLIVVAIVGILTSVGFTRLRPPEARLFGSSLQAQVQQARFEAIKRNRPVAIVWNGTENAFLSRINTSLTATTLPCTGTSLTTLKRTATSEYRAVNVSNPFPLKAGAQGLVWLPNGRIRLCDNTTIVSSASAKIQDDRATLYVKVSPGGKAELSNAP